MDEPAMVAHLKQKESGFEYQSIRKIKDSPFYEITIDGTNIIYVTDDGRFAFNGELINLETKHGYRTERRQEIIREELSTVSNEHTLYYPAKNPKAIVNVFIDLECPHCRRFAGDIIALNEAGYTFRLFFSPNGELNSVPFKRAVALWCTPDREMHLLRSFDNVKTLEPKEACPSPVYAGRELARSLGFDITPTFVLEDGRVIKGYRSQKDLLTRLNTALWPGTPGIQKPVTSAP